MIKIIHIKIQFFIEILKILWFKVVILLNKMELVGSVFMEINLMMKILKLNIKNEDIYLWLIVGKILIVLNFLFFIKILHI